MAEWFSCVCVYVCGGNDVGDGCGFQHSRCAGPRHSRRPVSHHVRSRLACRVLFVCAPCVISLLAIVARLVALVAAGVLVGWAIIHISPPIWWNGARRFAKVNVLTSDAGESEIEIVDDPDAAVPLNITNVPLCVTMSKVPLPVPLV